MLTLYKACVVVSSAFTLGVALSLASSLPEYGFLETNDFGDSNRLVICRDTREPTLLHLVNRDLNFGKELGLSQTDASSESDTVRCERLPKFTAVPLLSAVNGNGNADNGRCYLFRDRRKQPITAKYLAWHSLVEDGSLAVASANHMGVFITTHRPQHTANSTNSKEDKDDAIKDKSDDSDKKEEEVEEIAKESDNENEEADDCGTEDSDDIYYEENGVNLRDDVSDTSTKNSDLDNTFDSDLELDWESLAVTIEVKRSSDVAPLVYCTTDRNLQLLNTAQLLPRRVAGKRVSGNGHIDNDNVQQHKDGCVTVSGAMWRTPHTAITTDTHTKESSADSEQRCTRWRLVGGSEEDGFDVLRQSEVSIGDIDSGVHSAQSKITERILKAFTTEMIAGNRIIDLTTFRTQSPVIPVDNGKEETVVTANDKTQSATIVSPKTEKKSVDSSSDSKTSDTGTDDRSHESDDSEEKSQSKNALAEVRTKREETRENGSHIYVNDSHLALRNGGTVLHSRLTSRQSLIADIQWDNGTMSTMRISDEENDEKLEDEQFLVNVPLYAMGERVEAHWPPDTLQNTVMAHIWWPAQVLGVSAVPRNLPIDWLKKQPTQRKKQTDTGPKVQKEMEDERDTSTTTTQTESGEADAETSDTGIVDEEAVEFESDDHSESGIESDELEEGLNLNRSSRFVYTLQFLADNSTHEFVPEIWIRPQMRCVNLKTDLWCKRRLKSSSKKHRSKLFESSSDTAVKNGAENGGSEKETIDKCTANAQLSALCRRACGICQVAGDQSDEDLLDTGSGQQADDDLFADGNARKKLTEVGLSTDELKRANKLVTALAKELRPLLDEVFAEFEDSDEFHSVVKTAQNISAILEEKNGSVLEYLTQCWFLKQLAEVALITGNVTLGEGFLRRCAWLEGDGEAQFQLAHLASVRGEQRVANLYYYFGSTSKNIESALALSFRYAHGTGGVAKSCLVSLRYLESAAHQIFGSAQTLLRQPLFVEQISLLSDDSLRDRPLSEDSDAVDYLKQRAEGGDLSSLLHVGSLLFYGLRGVRQDVAEAKRYFEKALQLFPEKRSAYGHLGNWYARQVSTDWSALQKGTAVVRSTLLQADSSELNALEVSVKKALEYYSAGAKLNDSTSMLGMGFFTLNGVGVRRNASAALNWFKSASRHSDALGAFYAGLCYLTGTGTPLSRSNPQSALAQFMRSAHGGLALALYYAGQMYMPSSLLSSATPMNRGGASESCRMASMLIGSAVQRSFVNKRLVAGRYYYLRADYRQSFASYSALAEMGFERAQTSAAFLLSSRLLTAGPKHWFKHWRHAAFGYLQWSALLENSDSQRIIGDYYYYGWHLQGVDLDKAARWYQKAAENVRGANAQALYNLATMHHFANGRQLDFEMAKRYYDLSQTEDSGGFAPCQLALALLSADRLTQRLFGRPLSAWLRPNATFNRSAVAQFPKLPLEVAKNKVLSLMKALRLDNSENLFVFVCSLLLLVSMLIFA